MTLLTLEVFFVANGVVLAAVGGLIACDATHPQRWGSAFFWLLLAVAIGAGKWLPQAVVGYVVIALTLLVATKRVGAAVFVLQKPEVLVARAELLGNRLLWPVLVVPVVAVIGGLTLDRVVVGEFVLVNAKQVAQIALGLGCVGGLALALRTTGEGPRTAVSEGGRLLQLLGWALILPQMLAALGGIMGKAGVGDVIAQLVAAALPVHVPGVAVVAYCAGMALFTILLGNAFAAFPVMTLGVGLPFIVKAHGGDPAVMGALGMLSGYCGTLVTPMAANFNFVPVKLLELRDDFAVIKAQVPFAAAIWVFNVGVMYACVYR
jgi:uncharacterized membrane protein